MTENETKEKSELVDFMTGPDYRALARMIAYFSYNSRYLTPKELKIFWDSLTVSEKSWWAFNIWFAPFK